MQAPSKDLLRALRSATFSRPIRCYSPRSTSSIASISSSARPCPLSRGVSSSSRLRYTPPASPPRTKDRGPPSQEDTQTDFGAMNILGNVGAPTTAIDACLSDGFHLDNGVKIAGGDGCLLVGGEAFSWRPWEALPNRTPGGMMNKKGQWDVAGEGGAWGVLELVWPKPDLLILGLGAGVYPISPETRNYINSLGVRVDVQDTRNAAAQFNLLATERGIENVAAALIPIGWKGR